MVDSSDEAFDYLLRRVARTPDTFGLKRRIVAGSRVLDRFDILRPLGAGGMGRVFSAFDHARQTQVALKTLGRPGPRSLIQLKREFRVAAELVHPNLIRLHELFCEDVEWFFTMDLIEGHTLCDFLNDEQSDEVLRQVFGQLATALFALHNAGTLHGDLKPSNFLINKSDHRVILLDFGLAHRLTDPPRGNIRGGTPGYMAPEQMVGACLTEAADWYSFGVVLREALTGHALKQDPNKNGSSSPVTDLERLCLDLLKEDPCARATGKDVLPRLGVNVQDATQTSSTYPPLTNELVGRDRELRSLQDAYEQSSVGRPVLVLLDGPSGIGKTALLDHFCRALKHQNAEVLKGRCCERESIGYTAIAGLVDDLVVLYDSLPLKEVERVIPKDITALTRLFPALRATSAIANALRMPSEPADQGVIRRRAIGAFREMLANLRQRSSLVLWIDDLQWSDRESALIVEPLLAGSAPVPLLFVGSYRRSAGHRVPMLDALLNNSRDNRIDAVEIHLGALDFDAAEQLAQQLLPRNMTNKNVAQAIAEEARGHPLFIAELAHAAAMRGLEPRNPVCETLAELISTRVAALPNEAQHVLSVIAIAGAPLPRSILRRTLGLDVSATERILDRLRANRLARTQRSETEDQIDIQHDRIREIVLQCIAPAEQQQLHLTLAQVLEVQTDLKPEFVASHFHAAGELARAGLYWIAAAENSFRTLAFERAAELYALGLRHAQLESAEARTLQVRRAESLAHAGKGAESAAAYLVAAENRMRDDAIELRRRAAEQLLLSGHMAEGLNVIDQVLDDLGLRATRTGWLAYLSFLLGRVRVKWRALRYSIRNETSLSVRDLARVDASWTVACSLGVVDFVRGADYQTEHLLLALELGEPRRILRALSLEVSYAATPGPKSEERTAELLAVVDALAQHHDDLAAIGLVALCRGIASYLQGHIERSLSQCREALGILTKCNSGVVWEITTARRFVIASLFYLGQFRMLSEYVPPLVIEAEDLGNLYAVAFFRTTYSNTAWLVVDNVEEAKRQLRLAHEEWTTSEGQLPHCWQLVGDAYLSFYIGDAAYAWERVQSRWSALVDAQLLRIGVLRVQLWHVRAVSALMAARAYDSKGQQSQAGELLDDAKRSLTCLRREKIAWSAPLTALVQAAIDAFEVNTQRAVEHLGRCIEYSERLGMRLYAAAARVRMGELIGRTEGTNLMNEGYDALVAEGVVNPKRMVDLLAGGFKQARAAFTN